ncbi:MAG: hypothetical protein LUC43_07825 [Burkholderiales bacterium]|nr:hypothetical protein [Burkholderiales bacterium]
MTYYWTELSIEYANQRSYLDDLYKVYPTVPNGLRDLNKKLWQQVNKYFDEKNNVELIKALLKMDLFPIKDSYVAFLKRDRSAIKRNPSTVDRLAGQLYEMGLDELYMNCSMPKEANRQMGPLFRNWIRSGVLGVPLLEMGEFERHKGNAVLDGSDKDLGNWARANVGYTKNKGLDFVAKFNGKYVIGEAKFLTDFGGHQDRQFDDAMTTLTDPTDQAVKVGILDGVLYIQPREAKMCKAVVENETLNILSALLLREFLYSL